MLRRSSRAWRNKADFDIARRRTTMSLRARAANMMQRMRGDWPAAGADVVIA
jgi:hypothetical protein